MKKLSLRQNEDGASIVEFAMIALPLCIIVMGGADLGHEAYVRSQLQGSLSHIARLASVEDPQFQASGSTLEERVENTLKEQMDPISPGGNVTLELENFTDFSGVNSPEKLTRDVGGDGEYNEEDGDCFEDLNENGQFDLDTGREGFGGASDVVYYEATITMPRLFATPKPVGLGKTMEVNATIAIRTQPYGAQATPPTICGTTS